LLLLLLYLPATQNNITSCMFSQPWFHSVHNNNNNRDYLISVIISLLSISVVMMCKNCVHHRAELRDHECQSPHICFHNFFWFQNAYTTRKKFCCCCCCYVC
jgi:hypothetical protein